MVPRSKNLHRWASRLFDTNNLHVIMQVGDSISHEGNSNRPFGGMASTWNVNWAGQYVSVGAQDMGLDYTGGTVRDCSQTLSDGVTANPLSQYVTGLYMAADAFATGRARYTLQNLNTHVNGDWTAGGQLKVRLCYVRTAAKMPSSTIIHRAIADANYAGLASSTHNLSTGSPGPTYIELDFPAAMAASPTREVLAVADFGGNADTYMQTCGAFFYKQGAGGPAFTWLAGAGWNTTHHLPVGTGNGQYTDAQLAAYIALFPAGKVDTVMLAIGSNPAPGEGTDTAGRAVFKANVTAIVARYVAALTAAGAASPHVCLRATWEVSADFAGADARADVLFEIASQRSDCSFLNLHQLVRDTYGNYSAWNGTLLADGIHQSAAGSPIFEQLAFREITANRVEFVPGGRGVAMGRIGLGL